MSALPGVNSRKVALTDRSLKALKPAPAGRRAVVWDALMPGLAVRVTDKGKRSFYAVKRRVGHPQPTWVLLGAYPVTTLAEARAAAREALGALMAGDDPAALAEAKRRAAEEAERQRGAGTFRVIAERFIADYLPHIRSCDVYARRIRDKLIPALGDKPIGEIRRRDVIVLLEKIAAESGKAAAEGALAVLRKLLNWALARDLPGFESNPAAAVKPAEIIGKSKARDRLLSDAELAAVWHATDAVNKPFATVYKLLLLTGARREEIAAARWGDFDEANATLTVPAERAKNGEAMLIPLPPLAVRLIAETPRFVGPHIFTSTGGRAPIGAFSQAKAQLDAALSAEGRDVPPFVIHDFRRAVRSGLGRLGVPPVVAELVLGHRQSGIVGVYDRHSYFEEKRAALAAWESRLLAIVAPVPPSGAEVVPLRARSRA
jgi:integrase